MLLSLAQLHGMLPHPGPQRNYHLAADRPTLDPGQQAHILRQLHFVSSSACFLSLTHDSRPYKLLNWIEIPWRTMAPRRPQAA
jgi:hypothetical protein